MFGILRKAPGNDAIAYKCMILKDSIAKPPKHRSAVTTIEGVLCLSRESVSRRENDEMRQRQKQKQQLYTNDLLVKHNVLMRGKEKRNYMVEQNLGQEEGE